MKAVAAQMKRIMERMKLVVNSFEEVCLFEMSSVDIHSQRVYVTVSAQ